MIKPWLIASLVLLTWGCGDDEDTDLHDDEVKTAAGNLAPSDTSGEPSSDQDTDTSPKENVTRPAGCSTDGRLCLIVSLATDTGFKVKAVIKEGGNVASNAQGNVMFSFTSVHGGEVEGFFDAEGEYHDFPEDASITIAVRNGEAVLYDSHIASSQFSANVDASFVLTARYENTTVELKACQIADTIEC